MHIQLSFDSFFISLAGGIGTLQFFHLFFSKRENLFANRIFALFLLTILYVNLLNWLWLVGLLAQVPHLFRTGKALSYIFAPLLYIYLRASLYKENKFRKYDWIYLLLVLLVFCEYIPFYLSPSLYKIQCIMKAELSGIDRQEGLLIGRFHGILFIVFDIFIASRIFKLVNAFKKTKATLTGEEKRMIRWVKHLVFISLIVLVVFLFFWFVKINARTILRFYFLQNASIVYFTSIYLLIKPSILNGTYKEQAGRKEDAIKSDIIPSAKFDHYNSIIEKLIHGEQVFLEKKLTLKMLSERSGISIHHLSAFINKKYSMSYTDFINKMRVDYIIQKISIEEWRRFTLEGLAKEAGFASRTAFFTAFKKFTNISPSDYLKKISSTKVN
jgi:AraC-like DNA-binding protein